LNIGLYLQDATNTSEEGFYRLLDQVSKRDIDLLVFPEVAWSPLSSEIEELAIFSYDGERNDLPEIESLVRSIAERVGCAIIFSACDRSEAIYSLYLNPSPQKGDTECKLYVKSVVTPFSVFDLSDNGYEEYIDELYEPISLNGYRLGMTICYDATMPAINRMYGLKEVDAIINSSGGHVDYKKWSYYQKVRAMENQCSTLCTMSYRDPEARNNSWIFGYNQFGEVLSFTPLNGKASLSGRNQPGQVYVCSLNKSCRELGSEVRGETDEYFSQQPTQNKIVEFTINPDHWPQEKRRLRNVEPGLYTADHNQKTLVFVEISGEDILHPETVQRLMYSMAIHDLPNKRYLIINPWPEIDCEYYQKVLSNVLKIRSAENYSAVILHSPNLSACFQVGRNKSFQVVRRESNGEFGIDLSRTTGPEAIWKNKTLLQMRASWRDNYELLLQRVVDFNEIKK